MGCRLLQGRLASLAHAALLGVIATASVLNAIEGVGVAAHNGGDPAARGGGRRAGRPVGSPSGRRPLPESARLVVKHCDAIDDLARERLDLLA